MASLKTLLRHARAAAKSINMSTTQEAVDDASARIPTGLSILKSMAECTMLGDLQNIRFNLDAAAMYLLRLLSESPDDGKLHDLKGGYLFNDAVEHRYEFLLFPKVIRD